MNFAVIGAGAWGTAMAVHLSRLGHTVTLVPRRFDQALQMSSARDNPDYLPGIPLPPSLQIGHELVPVLMEAEIVLLACPAQAMRETATRVKESLGLSTQLKLILSLAKGLELGTHDRPTQVIQAVLPDVSVGSLTGPTNAAEVAQGLPAAMVLAARVDDELLARVQAQISGPTLRVYASNDVIGVEMVRVGAGLGAQAETFYGLGGFGDLVATCHGGWSRNRQFGEKLGQGASIASLMDGRKTVVEGYKTTESFYELCRSKKIEAPILNEVYYALFADKSPALALQDLMLRELKRE
jgi:glycerol-3-phosphate dehydrogenase (NAD(P)+)